MQAFTSEDLSKDLKDLEFGNEILPVQHTLVVLFFLGIWSLIPFCSASQCWVNSLKDLHCLSILRTYLSVSWTNACNKSVHIFSDASERAVVAVGYLVYQSENGNMEMGFILGKSKVATKHVHTIPRLELCGAVLAVEIAESIATHLDLYIKDFTFYTDIKVVLGYIQNDTRRFLHICSQSS